MLVDRLHAPNQVLGLTSLMRVALEIPFFYYSSTVMQVISKMVSKVVPISQEHGKIDAMRWTLAISMILLSLRLGLYAAMSYFRWSAWVDLGVELLHGMIYATFYSAAVQLAASLAPTHLQATSQGLFGAIFTGFGSTIGSLLGGVINAAIGPTFLYTLLFAMDVVTVTLYIISILRSTRHRQTSAEV
jgi:MFS family permease